jgi:hypothetical protein
MQTVVALSHTESEEKTVIGFLDKWRLRKYPNDQDTIIWSKYSITVNGGQKVTHCLVEMERQGVKVEVVIHRENPDMDLLKRVADRVDEIWALVAGYGVER